MFAFLSCYIHSIRYGSICIIIIIIIYLFILTANGFSPGGNSTTIRHNTQITHITQNNTTIKRNTVHKTTYTIHNQHRMKIQQSQLQLYKVVLIKISNVCPVFSMLFEYLKLLMLLLIWMLYLYIILNVLAVCLMCFSGHIHRHTPYSRQYTSFTPDSSIHTPSHVIKAELVM
jgi:hypothetical protein